MVRVLFVCLGNICRSPMAEFIMKDMIQKQGLADKIYVESAGTSDEEEGNPVYYLAKNKLDEYGINSSGKVARQLKYSDYDKFDYIVGMENTNIRACFRIFGGDNMNKISRLLDFTDRPGDIDDPWYTRDFDTAYSEIYNGCDALLKYIVQNM